VELPQSPYYYFKNKVHEDKRKNNAGAKHKGYSDTPPWKRLPMGSLKIAYLLFPNLSYPNSLKPFLS